MQSEMIPQPFDRLLERMLVELRTREELFGIHRSLFYVPQGDEPYAQSLLGSRLDTPYGPAAGPHTQLAQNIVSAWLCGGRFMELKTVQILDELDISRPCIDMEDEGYNVEWSQELKLEQSAAEYINAWALVHVLPRLLGFPLARPGTVFNMSVGYDLEGIRRPRMVKFMDRLHDASEDIERIRDILRSALPGLADTEIPYQISNNATISTMHGCPPDQIESIGRHLLEERGLHTLVKLNPTLLGQEEVLRILHDELGYTEIEVPEQTFTHDLQYDQALEVIANLKELAAREGLYFGVKLSNTLPTANQRQVLPGDELYMSGRALYPVTVNLFHRLVEEFDGDLEVSYAAGADAENTSTLVACGARTVTAATDLLKPGGYGRLRHWVDSLARDMAARRADTLSELASDSRARLSREAREARQERRYHRSYYGGELPKVASQLEAFDCITAPCVARCAILQDIPEYAWWIARGEYHKALEVVLRRNPLPGITGYICNRLCETRCTRIGYDEPVLIRALKRVAVERGSAALPSPAPDTGRRAAIIGAGPAGLAAATYLALSGVRVTIFERRHVAGGWPAVAPEFRLPREVVENDVARIENLGVEFRLGEEFSAAPQELLSQGYDAVFLACGFQRDAFPGIEGENTAGTWGALDLLERVARGEQPELGTRVCVVGGGNTAMDAARTAQRLIGRPVTVAYRRTEAEMPADQEEVEALRDEGNQLLTLSSPVRVETRHGRVVGLECVRNELGEPGPDGRASPRPLPGSEHSLPADSVIFAIGQRPAIQFPAGEGEALAPEGRLAVDPGSCTVDDGVYAGGDLVRGPATIVQACSDGRRVAELMCQAWDVPCNVRPARFPVLGEDDLTAVKVARTRRQAPRTPQLLPPEHRQGFACVEQPLTTEQARSEAARCLQCSVLCDKCVEVCPNRANIVYFVTPRTVNSPVFACEGEALREVDSLPVRIEQRRQILHLHELCNECGTCATFCVHKGRPYEDKPRLYFDNARFQRQEHNAVHISGTVLRYRSDGEECRLERRGRRWVFTDPALSAELREDLTPERVQLIEPFAGQRSLRRAVELAVLFDGLLTSASHTLDTGTGADHHRPPSGP